MKNVVVLGDTGLLGQSFIQHYSKNKNFKVFGFSRHPFNIPALFKIPSQNYQHIIKDIGTEWDDFQMVLRKIERPLILNCIALTNLGFCETNPDVANELHVVLPARLAKLSKEYGAKYVQISTDQVFDGKKEIPYLETDHSNPINVYGRTKREGERHCLDNNPETLIIRTNIVGFRGWKEPTFAEWLFTSFYEEKEINLFDDFVTSSIHTHLLVPFIDKLIEAEKSGIFHLASRDSASKYQFGKLYAAACGFSFNKVIKTSLKKSNLVPQRPGFLALDCSKAEMMLEVKLPSIKQTIAYLKKDTEKHKKQFSHEN